MRRMLLGSRFFEYKRGIPRGGVYACGFPAKAMVAYESSLSRKCIGSRPMSRCIPGSGWEANNVLGGKSNQ